MSKEQSLTGLFGRRKDDGGEIKCAVVVANVFPKRKKQNLKEKDGQKKRFIM